MYLGNPVDSVVDVSGHPAVPSCYFCYIIILIILVGYRLSVGIRDGCKLISSVIGIRCRLSGTVLYLRNPSEGVVLIAALPRCVHHGHTLSQRIIAIAHGLVLEVSCCRFASLPAALIAFFHKRIQPVVVIPYRVAAVRLVGSGSASRIIGHLLSAPFLVPQGKHVSFQIVGIFCNTLHCVGHGSYISHHVVGIPCCQAARHRHFHQIVKNVIVKTGNQAICGGEGEYVAVWIVFIFLSQAHLVGDGSNTAARIVDRFRRLSQRIDGSGYAVIGVIYRLVQISLRICDSRHVIVFIILVAGGPFSRPGDRFNPSDQIVGNLRRFSFRIHAGGKLVNEVIAEVPGISQGVGHCILVSADVVAVFGHASFRIHGPRHSVHNVVFITATAVKTVCIGNDIVRHIVGKLPLKSQRRGDAGQTVYRIVRICVGTAVFLRHLCYQAV